MYKILLIVGALYFGISSNYSNPVREPKALETIPTPIVTPVLQAFEMDHYDDRAFEIAEVLESRGISSSAEELLELSQLIIDKSEEIGVQPSVILAMIDVESTFRTCARSRVGAKGLMQVMPHRILGYEKATEEYAFNYHQFYDPYWNIEFGADYLGVLIKRFGSLDAALSAYNMGPTWVSRKLRNDTFKGSAYASRVIDRVEKYDHLAYQ